MRHHQLESFVRRRLAAVGLVCGLALASWSGNAAYADDITPEKQHPLVSRILSSLLVQYHYNHTNLSDSVSSVLLDSYIQNLDPSRLYFLAADISSFEKYRYELDDSLIKGELRPAFLIFNTFKQRSAERFAHL